MSFLRAQTRVVNWNPPPDVSAANDSEALMSDITLFNSGASNGGDLSRLPRSVKKALAQVQGQGMVAAAQVEGIAFVASVAMQDLGQLSMQEALLAQQVPHAAGRAKAIVDTYTIAAMGVVSRMGR